MRSPRQINANELEVRMISIGILEAGGDIEACAESNAVTIPHVGHWAHHEAADLVTDTMKWWLKMRR